MATTTARQTAFYRTNEWRRKPASIPDTRWPLRPLQG
jgi:hypothetical protein